MKKTVHSFCYDHYSSADELSDADQLLVVRAREVCLRAYAPYSQFKVGAAALLEGGEIFTASNQESEVFPSGMCAERALLYYLQVHAAGRKILAMAVVSESSPGECYPCGACRQVMSDTEKRQHAPLRMIMAGAKSASVVERISDLLPFQFQLEGSHV